MQSGPYDEGSFRGFFPLGKNTYPCSLHSTFNKACIVYFKEEPWRRLDSGFECNSRNAI